jgi:hypothetical protein
VIELNEIKLRIQQGEEIEKILKEIDWKDFEKLISEILKKHDFKVQNNFRFRANRRFEVDVLAVRSKISLLIDCKKWGRGRHKKTGLKYAIQDQKERVKQLKKFLKDNPIAQNQLKTQKTKKFIPLIITWFEEDLIEHEDVFIIPIWKFNNFLLNLSEYI